MNSLEDAFINMDLLERDNNKDMLLEVKEEELLNPPESMKDKHVGSLWQ